MTNTIDMGSLQLRFLQSREDTDGDLDIFEMTLQPNGRMPVAHYHESWDETIYGVQGVTQWQVDGKDVTLTPGNSVFIKRGIVHGFLNQSGEIAKCLCILSPGALGPSYFKEMAALLSGGAPDLEQMKATMLRYGLVPAPGG